MWSCARWYARSSRTAMVRCRRWLQPYRPRRAGGAPAVTTRARADRRRRRGPRWVVHPIGGPRRCAAARRGGSTRCTWLSGWTRRRETSPSASWPGRSCRRGRRRRCAERRGGRSARAVLRAAATSWTRPWKSRTVGTDDGEPPRSRLSVLRGSGAASVWRRRQLALAKRLRTPADTHRHGLQRRPGHRRSASAAGTLLSGHSGFSRPRAGRAPCVTATARPNAETDAGQLVQPDHEVAADRQGHRRHRPTPGCWRSSSKLQPR